MDIQPILPSYYRLRLDDALRGRLDMSARQVQAADSADDLLFADVLTLKNISRLPTTTQDPGEVKHQVLDRKSLGDIMPDVITVKQLDKPEKPATMEHAHQYKVHSHLDTKQFRKRLEDRVRRSKRAGSECQFKDADGQCTVLFIRCGDRLQYSMRESGNERRFYHKCTYDWRNRGAYVLIVDDDRNMCDFCKSSFQIFMHYDADKVLTASSCLHAIEILARSKIEGKKIGLVIADIMMPGRSGYDLVNELYDRNFELEIVLMRAENELLPEPADYKGSAEILPNLPFVSGTLIKPFHSETLVLEVKRLKFGWEQA